jgi:tetratricopeptide (TPR) repeat protein
MIISILVSALLFAAVDSSVDLDTAFQNLKDAEQKKDVESVKKWAAESSRAARQIIKSGGAQAAGAERIEFAKQVETYADYALYATAIQAKDRKDMISLFEALEQQSPAGSYTKQLYGPYAAALMQTGQSAKAIQFAEKAIGNDPSNEDLLGILADSALSRKQFERAATYGARLATVLDSHPKPEGMSAADWEKKRSMLAGRGNWIAGVAYASLNRYSLADKHLRAALPHIKGNDQLMAAALFHLGVADYNLAIATHDRPLMNQALSFSQDATRYPGPYQQLAIQNVGAIKQYLSRWR